ncbi:hypothetical protein GCM10009789_68800 [Kribbella sancticallisti]|uniref:Glucose-methanol-choline oxidoreductase C-terminal domain-containing protein n=1 Tax=Kribbella sancticallisti TaxID=460087 RepID=A0ABP4Q9H6_9ACTN
MCLVADRPGVGANLQDHAMVPVVYTIAGELQPSLLNHLEAAAHISTGLDGPTSDIQPALVTVPVPTKLLDKGHPVCTLYASLLSPRSRGTVNLADASAHTTPLVDPAFFSDPADLDTLEAGVRIAREVGAAESLSYWRKDEAFPEPWEASRRVAAPTSGWPTRASITWSEPAESEFRQPTSWTPNSASTVSPASASSTPR